MDGGMAGQGERSVDEEMGVQARSSGLGAPAPGRFMT